MHYIEVRNLLLYIRLIGDVNYLHLCARADSSYTSLEISFFNFVIEYVGSKRTVAQIDSKNRSR